MQIFLIIVAFCGVCFIFWLSRDHGSYLYHRSGAQRICVDCNQEQWEYCSLLEADKWVALDPVLNPTCKCHKDVK